MIKNTLVDALGKRIDSSEVEELKKSVGKDFIFGDFSVGEEKYLLCHEGGLSLSFEADVLVSIHLRFDEKDGYEKYTGWIGDDLNHHTSLARVTALKGDPSVSGGGGVGFMGRVDPQWLRYDNAQYSIHYSFSESTDKISQVTLMDAGSVP